MPTFDNLDSLFKFLQTEIADSLKNDVAQEVKNIEQEKVITEVYDKYNVVDGGIKEPYKYKRRGWAGGLGDQKNMIDVVDIVGDEIILQVTNETKGQYERSLFIADLVEYGDGYNGKEYTYKTNRDGTAYQYLNPRPFTEETIKQLEASGVHVNILKNSLRKKGFNIV